MPLYEVYNIFFYRVEFLKLISIKIGRYNFEQNNSTKSNNDEKK